MGESGVPIPNRILTEDDALVVFVVGASLLAEQIDRPNAGLLVRSMRDHLDPESTLAGVVVTDLWYLNHEPLRVHPTVAIGPADRNALSAFLIGRLPRVYSIDHRLSIHLDLHLEDLVACLFGADPSSTADAAQIFLNRFGRDWLSAADRAARARGL